MGLKKSYSIKTREQYIKEAVTAANFQIKELQKSIKISQNTIALAQSLCDHKHDDGSTALMLIGTTHKEVHCCEICGLTVTA